MPFGHVTIVDGGKVLLNFGEDRRIFEGVEVWLVKIEGLSL